MYLPFALGRCPCGNRDVRRAYRFGHRLELGKKTVSFAMLVVALCCVKVRRCINMLFVDVVLFLV